MPNEQEARDTEKSRPIYDIIPYACATELVGRVVALENTQPVSQARLELPA